MESHTAIQDHAIWFKHLPGREILGRLCELPPEGEVMVEIDGVTGLWRRMKLGKDGRLPDAIIPVGPMKDVWNRWYRDRRGEIVPVRLLSSADAYLGATSRLFSEWSSKEDEEAFLDL